MLPLHDYLAGDTRLPLLVLLTSGALLLLIACANVGNLLLVQARRWANTLVVGEVALALLMTVGAGLLLGSLWAVRHVDPRFDSLGVIAFEIGLGQQYDTVTRVESFMNQLVERAGSIPGVASVALAPALPLTRSSYTTDYVAAGRPADGYGTEVAIGPCLRDTSPP